MTVIQGLIRTQSEGAYATEHKLETKKINNFSDAKRRGRYWRKLQIRKTEDEAKRKAKKRPQRERPDINSSLDRGRSRSRIEGEGEAIPEGVSVPTTRGGGPKSSPRGGNVDTGKVEKFLRGRLQRLPGGRLVLV